MTYILYLTERIIEAKRLSFSLARNEWEVPESEYGNLPPQELLLGTLDICFESS